MIIFYDKDTGKIKGTIDGRIHKEDHLRMWIGENTGRIICNWKKGKDEEKWKPDVESKKQADIFRSLDKGETSIKDYKVDVESGLLYRKKVEE